MMSSRKARGLAFTAGAASLITMGALTAGCASTAKEEPTTESKTSATMTESTMTESMSPSPSMEPSLEPTEKAVTPGGANSFTPSVNPTGPNTVCKEIVNGVCVR